MKDMSTTNTELTKLNKNQFLAAQLLATGKSGKAVAEELHVTAETVSRWQQEPQFKEYLNNILFEAQGVVKQRLTGMITRALDIMDSALDDESLRPRDKFIMGIKLLELCRIKEIAVKIDDNRDVERAQEILAAIKERERGY